LTVAPEAVHRSVGKIKKMEGANTYRIHKALGVRMDWLLPAIAGMMALGGLLHSRRLAETMGHEITSMNTGQGLVSNGVASVLVIGASLLGTPVSTTHVSTGSIFGIGMWTGTANWRIVGGILLAWVAPLPMGAAFAYLIGSGFRLL
jgi:inorganic phosphate transporter, PiT family